MKKIYLLACTAMLSTAISAQQSVKLNLKPSSSNEMEKGVTHSKSASNTRGVMQVEGSIVCITNYVASSTMDLHFILTTTNPDGEYIDSVAVTFPTGFTVNSSPTDTFPTEDNSGGDEILNGVSGQTISWGSNVDNTDNYGGIWAEFGVEFVVNVTIGASVTGIQSLTFFAKGDEYPTTPGDLSGTISVKPVVPVDMQALGAFIPGGCSLGNEQVNFLVKNNGTTPATGFGVSYLVNGGTPVVETYTGTVAPGDTALYTFTALLNMATAGPYNLKAITGVTADGDITNDTASYMSVSFAPTSVPYSTGFEATPASDLLGWTVANEDNTLYSWESNGNTGTAHSGALSLRVWENVGASNDWLFSSCMDFTSGTNYRIAYWKLLNTTYAGSLKISLGDNASPLGMTQTLSVLTPLVANSLWAKDSVDFTVPTSGVYYIGFEAVNVDTTKAIYTRLDDVNIKVVTVTGVNEEEIGAVSVYPSPSTGIFNINVVTQNTLVEVFNLLGEKIYSSNQLNKGVNSIDLTNVARGTYFVKINSGNKVAMQKVIIRK